MSGYGPGLPGLANQMFSSSSSSSSSVGVTLDAALIKRIENTEKMLEKISERLAILDDPNPERLARHKMLKEAYIKYLFIEKLCMEEDIKDNES